MDKQLDKQITQYLSDNRDNFIKDLRDLLSFNSVNGPAVDGKPFGVEPAKAIDFMMNLCSQAGMETKNYDYYCMDATVGKGEEVIGALCHLDIVPAGDANDWDYPPFEGQMEGSLMYARGVCDDKGPAIAIFYAVKALMEAGVELNKTIKLIFGSDEETGMSDMEYYLTKAKAPDYAFSPDAEFPVIFAEKHVMGGVYTAKVESNTALLSLQGGTAPNAVPGKAEAKIKATAAPASTDKLNYSLNEGVLTITATGVPSHASLPEQGENAINTLLGVLADLLPEGDSAKLPIKNLLDGMSASDGSGLGIDCKDDVTGALTLNHGVISYEDSVIKTIFDIRHPVTLDYKATIATLENAIDGFKLAESHYSEGIHRPKDGLLVSTLQNLYREISGDNKSQPIAIGGGTYARCLPNAVAFGPVFPDGNAGGAHTINEYADIDELIKAARLYAHCLYSLANP